MKKHRKRVRTNTPEKCTNTRILVGSALSILEGMPDNSVQCIVTSPPYYGLRRYYATERDKSNGELAAEWNELVTSEGIRYLNDDYGVYAETQRKDGSWSELGQEKTPEEFVSHLVEIMEECRRVLAEDGTLWVNMGDSYASMGPNRQGKGSKLLEDDSLCRTENHKNTQKKTPQGYKSKDLIGVPWLLAFSLRKSGWYLRQDIIWSKPNPMPESVTDRCTKAHEYVFLLSKSERYHYDAGAIKLKGVSESPAGNKKSATRGRIGAKGGWDTFPCSAKSVPDMVNRRSVWSIPSRPFPGAHFATFPPDLVTPMIKAGSSSKGVCPECGRQWVREAVTEDKEKEPEYRKQPKAAQASNNISHRTTENGTVPSYSPREGSYRWVKPCKCPDTEPIPSVILDPFGGVGTTGMVAAELGRNSILIEAVPTYARMARKRIFNHRPLSNSVKVEW